MLRVSRRSTWTVCLVVFPSLVAHFLPLSHAFIPCTVVPEPQKTRQVIWRSDVLIYSSSPSSDVPSARRADNAGMRFAACGFCAFADGRPLGRRRRLVIVALRLVVVIGIVIVALDVASTGRSRFVVVVVAEAAGAATAGSFLALTLAATSSSSATSTLS